MKHTEVVDWRVWKAAQVAADAGAVKAGDHVYIVTKLQQSHLGDINFITPSPVALALNLAIAGAKEASQRRATLKTESTPQHSDGPWIPPSELATLYQFFEQCMVGVTFSYQAIEAFSNQLIIEGLKDPMQLERKDGPVEWTPAQVERRCSTEEKVAVVLPFVTKAKTPKGTKLWENFRALKDLRDDTIHLKSEDQYVRGRPDDQTLYFRLLNADPLDGPRTAMAVIKYFSHPDSLEWLKGAEAQL